MNSTSIAPGTASEKLPPRAPGASPSAALFMLPKKPHKLLKPKKKKKPKSPPSPDDAKAASASGGGLSIPLPPPDLNADASDDVSNAYGLEFSIDSSSTTSSSNNNSPNDQQHSIHGFTFCEEHKQDETSNKQQKKATRNNNRRIAASDVASVGNASDTMVTVQSGHDVMSGRELHETAKLALNQQDYARALHLFEAIWGAQVKRFGTTHASVAAAMHNVGVCRQRMGQYEQAEQLFVEAVSTRQLTLGVEHLEVAASLSKLGASRVALQQYDKAFCDLRRALRIATINLGPSHKTVAQISSHLACLYFEAGELMAAQATFEDALEIYRQVWREQVDRDACMLQLTDTLCNIGSIQNRRKLFADATDSFAEALDLQRGVLGHDHARLVPTLDNLGYSYSKNKQFSQALSCYKTMLKIQMSQSVYGDDHNETLQKCCLMFDRLGLFSDAVTAVSLVQSQLPSDSPFADEYQVLLANYEHKVVAQQGGAEQ